MGKSASFKGGLLSGLGRGLVQRAENEREERLIKEERAYDQEVRTTARQDRSRERLEDRAYDDLVRIQERGLEVARAAQAERARRDESNADRTFTREENEAERRARSKEAADDRAHESGEREKDRWADLGLASVRQRSGSGQGGDEDGAFGAGGKRAWDMAKEAHTEVTAGLDGDTESTDWDAVAEKLAPTHPQLAAIARRNAQSGSREFEDPFLQEYIEEHKGNPMAASESQLRRAVDEGRARRGGAPTAARGLPEGIPAGARLIGHTRSGAPVYETSSGERLVAE